MEAGPQFSNEIYSAAATGRTRELRRLCTGKPKRVLDGKNPGGVTSLLVAVRQGYDKCAKVLIDAGADINMADPEGHTPLMIATICGYESTVKLLIDAGADVNLKDNHGLAAIDYSVLV